MPPILALLMLVGLICPAGATSDYPQKPITMIVPFAPGGASDVVARLMQPRLLEYLGQPVVIENRAGAAGNIGMDVAGRALPDGYTVFLGNVGTIAVNPAMFESLTVQPTKAFAGVSLVSETPQILVVRPSLPVDTVQDLVAAAKAKPGRINFASPGSGSLARLVMELFRLEAGVEITHVPYKGGAGPAVSDVVGGHVDAVFVSLPSAQTQVQGNRLKALAVTTDQRVPGLPNVPTMKEAGFPDLVTTAWQGVFVPAGTPPDVIRRWHAAIAHALSDPTVATRMREAGLDPATSQTPQQFDLFVAAEAAKWAKVVAATGATPE